MCVLVYTRVCARVLARVCVCVKFGIGVCLSLSLCMCTRVSVGLRPCERARGLYNGSLSRYSSLRETRTKIRRKKSLHGRLFCTATIVRTKLYVDTDVPASKSRRAWPSTARSSRSYVEPRFTLSSSSARGQSTPLRRWSMPSIDANGTPFNVVLQERSVPPLEVDFFSSVFKSVQRFLFLSL